jgi:uncharacterized membrane protein YgcG
LLREHVRRLVICILAAIPCYAIHAFASEVAARPTQKFTDIASFVPSSQAEVLNRRLAEFARRTGIDYYVYVTKSVGDESDEAFVRRRLDQWQLGSSGLALFVFVAERRTRMETWGTTQNILTDNDLKYLIDNVITRGFRGGDRLAGIANSIDAISNLLAARQAEREREAAAAARAAAFIKKYNIKQVVTATKLTTNPFVYQGQIVAIYGEFDQMSTSSRALFVAADRPFLVSNVPPTRFTVPHAMVLLAVRVEGNIETHLPASGSAVVPHVSLVGSVFCQQNGCADYPLTSR